MDTWLSPTFWQEIISQTVAWIITTLPSLLIIFVMAFLALKLTNIFLDRLKPLMIKHMESGTEIDTTEMEKRIDTLLKILRSMIKIIVWLMIGMLILRKIGIDIAPIIAGAGIVGLAIGFGAQELVRDFISGFFMLLENQIRNGDVAIITYKEDTDRVVDVIQQVADEQRADPDFKNKILEPIEIFGVDQFGDSAVVIKARFKTKPIEQWAVGREFRRRLKKAFDDQGIEIPFPHRTVYWGEEIKPLQIKTCRSPVK